MGQQHRALKTTQQFLAESAAFLIGSMPRLESQLSLKLDYNENAPIFLMDFFLNFLAKNLIQKFLLIVADQIKCKRQI